MFASLKVRDYRYLWAGILSSAFALNMQTVAQGWLVYEMSSSAMDLTWVTLAFFLPQVLFALPGGVIADRLPKKPILVWAPVVNGMTTAAMALIIMFGDVSFWHFVGLGLLLGTMMALSLPGRIAMIPEIVGQELVFNAMAFSQTSWNLSRVLGPLLAGFMIAIFADGDTSSTRGVGLVFFVLTGLYMVSAVSVLFVSHSGEPAADRKPSHPLQEMKEGISYVVNSPVVGGLILLSILPFLFGLIVNTLLPAFSTDVLEGGPDDLGLLVTGMGGGAILGSLALAKMGGARNKGYLLIASGSLWGALIAVFALTTSFALSVAAIAGVGFMSAANMSMNRSLLQLQTERRMRGRIMSIDLMSHGLMPLGALPIGFIADTFSVSAGIFSAGILLCLSTLLVGGMLGQVRGIDLGHSPAAERSPSAGASKSPG